MGFVADLLGGGKKGTPGQVVDTTPDEFVELRRPVSDLLRGLLTGTQPNLSGIPAFEGPFVAGMTEGESNILNRIQSMLSGPSATGTAANNLLTQTLRGDFLRPESNPFLQATIDAAIRPIRQQFEEVVMPDLRSRFTAAGQIVQNEGSSPFARAQALATGNFLNTVSDVATRIASENFQAERGRQQNAVTQALQMSQADLNNLIEGLRASALPRLIEQQGLTLGLQEFNRRVDTLLRALALAQSAAGPNTAVIQGTPGTSGQDIGSLLRGSAALWSVL